MPNLAPALSLSPPTAPPPSLSSTIQPPPPSSLSVVVALWGKKPPRHQVTCIQCLHDDRLLVTGGDTGELVLWEKDGGNVLPKIMLLGHETAITAMSPVDDAGTTRFVSASTDGCLTLWDGMDGRSIDSVFMSQVHRKIQPHRKVGSSRDSCRLYCIGEYPDILVIDPQDLVILYILSSRVEPDWISAIAFIHNASYQGIVIGSTVGGLMKIWNLHGSDKKEGDVYEIESKAIETWDIQAITWSPLCPEIIFVFTTNTWQMYELTDLKQLDKLISDVQICDARFLSDGRLAVARADCTVYIYQLPNKYFADVQGSEKPIDKTNPSLQLVLHSHARDYVAWLLDIAYCFGKGRMDSVYCVDSNDNLIWWSLDDDIPDDEDSSNKIYFQHSTLETNLLTHWNSIEQTLPYVFNPEENFAVTATHYISSQGNFLIGREDGIIIMLYGCAAVSTHLFSPLNKELKYRRLHGHKSSVTCFIYPHEEHVRFDRQLVLSGSSDFSVIVWNLNTGSRLYRFCSQGGSIQRFLVPPENCSPRISHCVCSIAADNSAALLSLKENKCLLLAARQTFPVVDVKWRPLDDFMLLKCEDESVYIWQMDTANLERIIFGQISEEIMAACDEQIGVTEGDDEAGASQAVQMFRAFKNRNISALRQIASGREEEKIANTVVKNVELPPSMTIQAINKYPDSPHLIFFNIDSLIADLVTLDNEFYGFESESGRSLSTILSNRPGESRVMEPQRLKITWQAESNLCVDIARLCMSLLHAWTLDSELDTVCNKKLRLAKPIIPLCFGIVSRQGHISVHMPMQIKNDTETDSFDYFASSVRWSTSSPMTTVHLLSIISLANTLMSLRGSIFDSTKPNPLIGNALMRASYADSDSQAKQGWSLLAALHCCLLPEMIKPKSAYCPPRIELLARRWQDRCVEIRLAGQALITRELTRLGSNGRKSLLKCWSTFLPTLLDPTLSIFGARAQLAAMNPVPYTSPPPPIPPRSARAVLPNPTTANTIETKIEQEAGIQQIRRNQATAVVLLGVIGAEFPDEMGKMMDIARATAQSLLELLIAPPSNLLPLHSPLRRAAIDLIGRGFAVWQPHLEITKVLITLLDFATSSSIEALSHKSASDNIAILSPTLDICRTARHALGLIASARPPAVITALSKEVARYNITAQHQTIQHAISSPLMKCRTEVLRVIELLAEKQYTEVADLIIPVGDILVHCLDTTLLKHKSLSEVFPPITKFYMVAYCANTRRLACGGKNGTVVVHELRASKSQTLQAHKSAVTALSFSEDGKYLATYGAQEAKLLFWQTSQTFLGMGQSQLKCIKNQPAPAIFPVLSPSGTSLPFRARLVWISPKSVTLMMPDNKEYRFAV